MDINFELYKVFYEVANEKSISRGAEKLMISQPAVTQAIRTLEDQLDGKLFIRTPKGVILTNEGQELFNYIKEGMNYFVNGTNKFMSLKELQSGVINIGSTTTISEHFLMPFLKKFHSLYPNVEINIINDLTDNLIKGLRNGSLDIIIITSIDDNIKDIDINYICDLNDIFIGKEEDRTKVYDIKTLFDKDIILQKSPSVMRTNFNNYLKEKQLSINPKMEVVSHSLLCRLVENGFGIGLATKEFVLDKLGTTLFEVKTDFKIPTRKLSYGIKGNSISSFTTKKFIDILVNEVK